MAASPRLHRTGYRRRLYEARDRARAGLQELDEEELTRIASEGRRIVATLDEEAARVTISLTNDRERRSRVASNLQAESERLARQGRWTLSPRRRRQARIDAAETATEAEKHRQMAAQAHEQLRELGRGARHLYPWFEQHEETLARGLGAEFSPTPRSDRAIDIERLEEVVAQHDGARQRLLFEVAAELYGRERGVPLSELLAELDAEDLDRVLQAIAMVERRQLTGKKSPTDLWTRAAEPEE